MAEAQGAPELSLPPGARAECARLLTAAQPREACALLIGRRRPEERRVEEIIPIPNTAEGEGAFALDPIAWREAELEARAEGLEVLGVWHSHPRAEALPSARDRVGAQPGWSYAISCGAEPERLKSFLCVDGALVEQRVTTRPQSCAARL